MSRHHHLLHRVLLGGLLGSAVMAPSLGCATTVEGSLPGRRAAEQQELTRLKRDIVKVDRSLAVTRDLIQRSRGERYLPDLYFRQAELLIEKSRLVYFRILEEAGADDKTAVVAPEARLLKEQAIGVYRRVLAEFPDYADNDKVTFFIAHEHRELGNYAEMLKTHEELVRRYPRSALRFESWLVLGDYRFDKGDIDAAIENYKNILKLPETHAHNMARYKLAWCYINKDRPALAVDLWEQAVRTPTALEPGIESARTVNGRPPRLDVRQDALRDLAFYYSEARDPRTAIAFFRGITLSRAEYRLALEKLARRFQIKSMLAEAAQVHRELLAISRDVERNIEWAEAIYEAAIASRDLQGADDDVVLLAEVAARYKYWWRASDEDKDILADFELLSRDLATRLHTLARDKGDAALHQRAARAYDGYLSVFQDSSERLNMEWNYAEALYAAKRFVQAGRQYEKIIVLLEQGLEQESGSTAPPTPLAARQTASMASPGPARSAGVSPGERRSAEASRGTTAPGEKLVATTGTVDGDKKQALYGAILAYFEALKTDSASTRLHSLVAREGIKDLGARFVSLYPDDANTPQVKFNIARSWYEQGLFDEAIPLFAAFAVEHPTNKDSIAAAELALDAFAQQEDFGGLATLARAFAADARLDAGFRERAGRMAEQAEQEDLNRKTIAAEGNVAVALQDFVVEKKGSDVAARALAQGFAVARDRRNLAEMEKLGRQLLEEYGSTRYAVDVLPGLADIAVRSSRLEAAAGHYEEQARRFPDDPATVGLLENAAAIRAELGEFAAAVADYERLARLGDESRRGVWLSRLAEQAARVGDWRRVEDAGIAIADQAGFQIVGNAWAGEAALRTGKPEVALERLTNAVNARSKAGDEVMALQARAQFLIGEIVRAEFETIALTGNANDGELLQKKFALLEELEAAYVAAIQLGEPEWALGGLYRIANAYQHAALFLEKAPVPSGTTAADEKALRAALAERAGPLKKKSAETLETCRAQAKKLEAFNRFAKACLTSGVVDDEGDNPRARPGPVPIPGRDALEAKLVDNPKDITSLLALVRAALQARDAPMARLLAVRAVEIDDKNADALNLLGVASFHANHVQAAAAAFKRALKQNGRHPQALQNLGTLWALYGDLDRARESAGRAVSVDTSAIDVLPLVRTGGTR
jgi:tetratricopeptide (TPR) repeat protein